MGELVHLKQLDLGHNNLTGTFPSELGRLERLQVLYLRENLLSGSLPPGVLTNLTDMRYLMLQKNALSGGVPSQIGLLRELNELRFSEPARGRSFSGCCCCRLHAAPSGRMILVDMSALFTHAHCC